MKWLISIIAVLFVVVAGLLIAPNFVNWSSYKEEGLRRFTEITGLQASIGGDISLAILPSPRIYVEDVTVLDPTSSDQALAAFKLLDVRVALGALLNKQVEVTSINLDEPNVRLVKNADGKFNFMTPQIEAMMKRDEGGEDKPATTSNVAVSFDKITIDNGAFLYQTPDQTAQLSAINLDVKADDLSGPFAVKGDLSYNGQPVQLDLKTGEVDPETMGTSLNLKAGMSGADISFAGAVKGGDAPSAQGELVAAIDRLEQYAPNAPLTGSASVRGVVSAGADAATLKDATIEMAGTKLSGSADVKFSPMSVSGAFRAAEPLNLDLFIKKSDGVKTQSSPLAVTQALPKTLELPVLGTVKLSLAFPAVIYNGARFEDAGLEVANTDKGFSFGFDADSMPGKGPLQVNGALNFAEKSVSQASGKAVYSNPSLTIRAKGQSANPAQSVQALSGASGLPLISTAKSAVFDTQVKINSSAITLEEAVVNLDNDAYSAKGALTGQSGSDVPLLKASVVADSINFDTIMGGSGDAKKTSSGGAKSAGIPFDMELDANIHKATFQGKVINGLKVGARMADQKLVVNRIAASDFDGQKFDVSGIVTVDMAAAKPTLSGKIQLGDLTWKSEKKTAAQRNGTEKWSSAAIDSGWMNAANIDFEVAANSINYEGWQLSKPSIVLSLKDSVLNISDLKAGIYSGSMTASATMRPAQGASGLAVDGKAALNRVQMEPLVTSLAAGSRLIKGRGVVSLNTDIKGSGQSIKALIGSLNGSGTVDGSDIVIEGVDVQRFVRALSDEAKPGDSVLNLWKGVGTGGSTSFETLDGAYKVQQGVVNIEKLLLDGPRAAIATTGQIYLVPWTIQTAHVMSVKDRTDVPSFTVNISGSLDNPTQTFAQGVLNDYLQRKIERKLNKVIQGELGDKLDKKLGLDGVLKGVLGGGSGGAVQQQPAPEPEITPQEQPASQAPADDPANDNAPAPEEQPAPQQNQEPTPEEAVEGLIKGLFGQ